MGVYLDEDAYQAGYDAGLARKPGPFPMMTSKDIAFYRGPLRKALESPDLLGSARRAELGRRTNRRELLAAMGAADS